MAKWTLPESRKPMTDDDLAALTRRLAGTAIDYKELYEAAKKDAEAAEAYIKELEAAVAKTKGGTAMKYRKKPVVIEAVQYTTCEPDAAIAFMGGACWCNETGLIIPTLEGEMQVSDGDWVIKGVNGEFYPCKPDIFKKTYEKVEKNQ